MIVFGSPFSGPGAAVAAVAAAGGTIVSGTRLASAVVADFGTEHFQTDLYRNGAIFVADAALAIACFNPLTPRQIFYKDMPS